MLSERGKKLIILDKFSFRKDKETKLGVTYRCTNRKCVASITVDKSEEVILERRGAHNHAEVENIGVKKIQNSIKRKATEDISERPSKILNAGLRDIPLDVNVTTKDILNIRQSLYRTRRGILPVLPRSRREVHDALRSLQHKTSKGEDFLLVNDEDMNIVIFSCLSNLQYLCSRPKIYVDGTFNYCPKFFTQMFSIHTVDNGHYIPLVFILLPNKVADTYFQAFKLLASYCESVNLSWKPEELVSDFERAIHIGAIKLWPDLKILGCRFHLTQSWFRKIQNLGLACEYKSKESEVGCWLRWSFGLLYLDPAEVEECFVEDLYSTIPQNAKVVEYADYLVDNYISQHSAFPPQLWAICSGTRERTTNACESFHSHFNSCFYVAHPDIFKFLSILKDIQVYSYIKINSVSLEKKMYK